MTDIGVVGNAHADINAARCVAGAALGSGISPVGFLNVPDDWRLVEPDGTVTIFDGADGLIKSQTTPGGQVTEFLRSTTTTVPRIGEMRGTFVGNGYF